MIFFWFGRHFTQRKRRSPWDWNIRRPLCLVPEGEAQGTTKHCPCCSVERDRASSLFSPCMVCPPMALCLHPIHVGIAMVLLSFSGFEDAVRHLSADEFGHPLGLHPDGGLAVSAGGSRVSPFRRCAWMCFYGFRRCPFGTRLRSNLATPWALILMGFGCFGRWPTTASCNGVSFPFGTRLRSNLATPWALILMGFGCFGRWPTTASCNGVSFPSYSFFSSPSIRPPTIPEMCLDVFLRVSKVPFRQVAHECHHSGDVLGCVFTGFEGALSAPVCGRIWPPLGLLS